ncbi:MAG: hypothetical protein IT298_09160 [Chloroflexi bacterium]|nr:hypothetical protein [Chloroflexota bacterium]
MSSKDPKSNPAAEAMERLIAAQRVGQALFEREARRMATKHGLDDPRTQKMLRSAGGARDTLDALEIALESRPPEVAAAEGEVVVAGRVAADDLRGVSRATVSLEDASGHPVKAAGAAVTDAAGRYALRIAPSVAAKLAGKEYVVVAADAHGKELQRSVGPVKLALNETIRADLSTGARPPLGAPVTPRKPRQPRENVTFTVSGTVMEPEGKPAANMLVRVYDKDVKYDDLLGAAMTNRKGEFTVTYRLRDFSEDEDAADLYFVVTDSAGKERLSTADRVMFNAEREATVELVLLG